LKKGLKLIEESLTYEVGYALEASCYYIQSKLYCELGEYNTALLSIEKALSIINRELYRKHKEVIEIKLLESVYVSFENFAEEFKVKYLKESYFYEHCHDLVDVYIGYFPNDPTYQKKVNAKFIYTLLYMITSSYNLQYTIQNDRFICERNTGFSVTDLQKLI
jgi:tetratricopeptide (TPR) repeat protein